MQGPSMTRDDTVGSTAMQSIPPGAVSRFRPFARRAAACGLAAALAMLLGFAAPAQAQTSVKLVGNTGETSTNVNFVDYAQAFTAGSSSAGYKLTRVDLRMNSGTGGTAPTFTVKIYSDSSSLPGTSLGTLTQQGSLPSTAGLVQFNASGSGIDLDKGATYWVVVDITVRPHNSYRMHEVRNSGDEDSNPASGWSIANSSLYRGYREGDDWTTDNTVLALAIYGYAKPQPKVTGVKISSTPSLDVDGDNTRETYGLGEKIQVQATFDKNVTVTGTPRLKIDFSSEAWGEKWANYESGSGTKVLTFSYTVATPNVSTQGIAVLENTLELNGGTIKDADSVDATLTHTGLGP